MKFTTILSLASLLVAPVTAQFGLAGKKARPGASFEELQEQAKRGAQAAGAVGGGEMDALQEMLAGAFDKNPEMMKAFESMGEDVMKMMNEMANMSADQLQAQMQSAMEMMSSGNILDSVVERKDEVLANLEATGLVSKEEIDKYRADPVYFEQQMKGAFDQMKGVFSDPDLMKNAAEAMTGLQKAAKNPILQDLQELLMRKKTPSDLEIEELRLRMLKSKDTADDSVMAILFGDGDFAAKITSAKEWKEGVMEGRAAMASMADLGLGGMAGMGAGAGVGEL